MNTKKNEGYTKFLVTLKKGKIKPSFKLRRLSFYRYLLYKKRLIGMTSEGIGFGNISRREEEDTFLITGTQTGAQAFLPARSYSLVLRTDLANNNLVCKGEIAASSESFSHAVIYRVNSAVKYVTHIHNHQIWEYMLNNADYNSTPEDAEFGSIKLAQEIREIARLSPAEMTIVLAGHEDGVIISANSLWRSFLIIRKLRKKAKNPS